MARYHATVESRRSATETFGYLVTFSRDHVAAATATGTSEAGAGRAGRCRVPVPGISSRLAAKPETPPASAFTAATEYSRPR